MFHVKHYKGETIMATRKRKHKKMTTTEKYTRVQTGLKFFGVELKELKKATAKALKNAQKIYKDIRKQLKQEGVTDIPTITQLAKEVIRRETQSETPSIPQAETREPLNYADADEIAPYIDFASDTLDAFLDDISEAMNELAGIYGLVPQIWNTMAQQHAEILSTFNQLRTEMGEENLASYIENSLEYDKITTITKISYNEAVEVLDNILSNLRGILSQAKQYNESPQTFIPQNAINLDNI